MDASALDSVQIRLLPVRRQPLDERRGTGTIRSADPPPRTEERPAVPQIPVPPPRRGPHAIGSLFDGSIIKRDTIGSVTVHGGHDRGKVVTASLEVRVDERADGERRQRERDQSAFFDLLLLSLAFQLAPRAQEALPREARPRVQVEDLLQLFGVTRLQVFERLGGVEDAPPSPNIRDVGLDPALELEKRGRRLYFRG